MYTKFSDAVFFTTFVVIGFIATTFFIFSIIAVTNPSSLVEYNQINPFINLSWQQTTSIISLAALTAIASASALVWRLTREPVPAQSIVSNPQCITSA